VLVGAHRGDRDRVGVVGVGLAAVSGVEHPARGGGRLRRNVAQVLAVGQQPLSQRPPRAVVAFDRPGPLSPGCELLERSFVIGASALRALGIAALRRSSEARAGVCVAARPKARLIPPLIQGIPELLPSRYETRNMPARAVSPRSRGQ